MKSHLKDSAGAGGGYRLRKNRIKTQRAASHVFGGDDFVPPCRECGRKFITWKGLFAHMVRYHSDGFEEEFRCRDGSDTVIERSQSSDNRDGFPNRKKRSQRRTKCDAVEVIKSLSLSSSDGVENELEEVAICLMMLSRDFFNGCGGAGYIGSSTVESSDDNSAPSFHKNPIFSDDDKDRHSVPDKGTNARTELSVSRNFKNCSKLDRYESRHSGIEIPQMGLSKNLDLTDGYQVKLTKATSSSSKRRFSEASDDFSARKTKLLVIDGAGSELDQDSGKIMTGGRFECNTCKRTFHSYQALGGHRASHSKSKGAYSSNDSTIEVTELSPSRKTTVVGTMERSNRISKTESKGDEHECAVCFKVFPSGQALGGHKRSHLAEATKNSTQRKLPAIPRPAHKVRDFLDLNLPASLEDDEGMSSSIVDLNPWWEAGRCHQEESLQLA